MLFGSTWAQDFTVPIELPGPDQVALLATITPSYTVPATSTEEFYFDGEQADTKDGLRTHRTVNVDGTLNGTASISTAQHHGGARSLLIGAAEENLSFPTANGVFTQAAGYISMWVYISGTVTGEYFVFISYPVDNNWMGISIDTSRYAKLTVFDTSTESASVSTAAIATGGWHQVEAKWSFATDNWDIRLDGGSWVSATTNLGTAPTTPTNMNFGDMGFGGSGTTIYVDDVQIWTNYNGT